MCRVRHPVGSCETIGAGGVDDVHHRGTGALSAEDVSPGLVITRRDATDRSAVIELAGYIDLSNGRLLTDTITKTLAEVRDITLDLTGLTFVDSTGLREFVTGYHQAANVGAGYRIVNPVGQVKQVLEMTGMLTFLTDGLSTAD